MASQRSVNLGVECGADFDRTVEAYLSENPKEREAFERAVLAQAARIGGSTPEELLVARKLARNALLNRLWGDIPQYVERDGSILS